MDDHTRELRELLGNALNYIKHVGANHVMRGEPHPQQLIVDGLEVAQRRLRSDGPDGLRVVPVKPTKKKTLNEQIVDAKKEIAGWNKERKAGVQLEGIDEAMLRAGGSRPMTDEHADKTDPYDLSAGDERDDG